MTSDRLQPGKRDFWQRTFSECSDALPAKAGPTNLRRPVGAGLDAMGQISAVSLSRASSAPTGGIDDVGPASTGDAGFLAKDV